MAKGKLTKRKTDKKVFRGTVSKQHPLNRQQANYVGGIRL